MMQKTRDELKSALKEALEEELEFIGIDVRRPEARQTAPPNFELLSTIAGMIDSTAKKIGYTILMAVICGVIWLAARGLKIKLPTP